MAVPDLVYGVTSSNSYGEGILPTNGEYRCHVEPTLPGNLGVIFMQWGPTQGMTFTCSDDKGNAWTSAGTPMWDSSNSQGCMCFYRPNMTTGTTIVKIKHTTGGATNANFVSVVYKEFNNIALTTPLDVYRTVASGSSGTTMTAASLTPSQTDDLLVMYVARDSTVSNAGKFNAGSQANINWQLGTADTQDGQACQWGQYTSVGAIVPTMSMDNSGSYIGICVAFKTVSAGTARTTTDAKVARIHHYSQPSAGTTMAVTPISNPAILQVPCIGNTLIAIFSSGLSSFVITGITDTTGATWEQFASPVSNGGNDTCQAWYSQNRTNPSSTCRVTVTYSSIAANDATVMFYDCVNLDPIQNNSETVGGQTGLENTPGGVATLATCSITPVLRNGLSIFFAQWEFNTANGLTLSNGLVPVFDSMEFDGMNVDGPQNCDQNGGWGHVYNGTVLSTMQATWSMINHTDVPNPISQWASMAVNFDAPPGRIRGNKPSYAQRVEASLW